MSARPTVSVLIPCYNAEKFIAETLDSVLRQTWSEIEVVVVDDGSQDMSVAAIERCGDPRVRLTRQVNAGASAARNRAFEVSRGAFVQFLDADDLIDPDKIEIQMGRMENLPRCVASSEWGRFRDKSSETQFDLEPVWRDLDPLEWLTISRAEGFGMLFPALWLVPRAIALAAGPWDESLSLGDDGEYFTRVLLASERVLFCPRARARYRSGLSVSLSGRKSPAAWASQFRVIELCEAHVRAREDTERVRRGFSLSWQHLAHGCHPYDGQLAARSLARARALHPVTIRPEGGKLFKLVSRLIGWRAARLLQVASGR